MIFLKQSTAAQSRAIGPFINDADFKTPETGLTIANTDIKLVVNGGASANKNSGGGTHRVNGVYGITFDATDTATVGEMEVSVVVSGALPVFAKFFVVEEAVYDMLFAASALGYINNAPVNVAQFGGSNGTFASGRPEVNTSHAAGTAWNSGAIGAATLASDTLTAAKIASDAITAAKIATGALTSTKAAAGFFDAVWTVAARTLTAATNITSTGGTTVPQTGDSFARIGAPVGASISADIAAVKAQTAAIETDTQDIQGRIPAALVSGRIDASVGSMTAGAIQAIWDALTAALTTAGSIGKLLVDNVDATISSRLPTANITLSSGKVTVGTNDDKTGYAIGAGGISAASFAAGAIDNAALAQSAGQEIADEILNRNIAGGGSGNTRNVRNALRALRNKVSTSGGTLTVYQEDDTTEAWTAALTRSTVDPITEVAPA